MEKNSRQTNGATFVIHTNSVRHDFDGGAYDS